MLAARIFAFQGFDAGITPRRRLIGYMYKREIYMVNSFQLTRSARFILAHRKLGGAEGAEKLIG